MNGVSRFLSRRDKHHEKRSAKNAQHKVRLNSFSSVNSTSPLLFSASDTVPRAALDSQRRQSTGLDCLWYRFPSAWRTSVVDSIVFLHENTPCRVFLTPITIQVSTTNSSDYLILQSHPSQVSSDLYTIFTNEDSKTAADKDGEKKVRR